MARVKVTTANIKQKLTLWAQGTNTADILVYITGDIDEKEVSNQAWQLAGVIVDFQVDSLSSQFKNIVYKEKL
jgi:hypothetical protein